jgi:hypothetical protein
LVYNSKIIRQILIKVSEKVYYIIFKPFSNLDFLFGAVRELKFTIQFLAPRLPRSTQRVFWLYRTTHGGHSHDVSKMEPEILTRGQINPWARSRSVVGSRSVFIIRQDFQTEFHQFCKKLCRWGPFRAAQCICKLCSFLGTSKPLLNSKNQWSSGLGYGQVPLGHTTN